MTDFTDYAETNIRDWMSQGSDMPAAPANIYVALHTSDPGESPDGTTEVNAADYDRVSTTAGTDWDTTLNPTGFDNTNIISFGQATNDWGTISHVSLWDSSGGGNCMAAFSLDSSVTINTDDTLEFNAGELSFDIE